MNTTASDRQRLQSVWTSIYGPDQQAFFERLWDLVCQFQHKHQPQSLQSWSEKTAVLITYGDQISSRHQSALLALDTFAKQHGLSNAFSTIHLLPFFPYSSDDGFSVIDYRAVDPRSGTWDDIRQLRRSFHLMFDLVLNHVSAQSTWFAAYRTGEAPFDKFFIEVDPEEDLSQVTRPRSLPLLTPVTTSRGVQHVWTTFSADQVDLNYRNPAVLLEMMAILLEYVERGAQLLRLDAVAFLWKEIGTSCMHLPPTHAVVKLMRLVLSVVDPNVWLLTETNVPHRENISYFGNGDEAHLVYLFSLPPLLLEAMLHRDATYLQQWLYELVPAPTGSAYFNFTASHDGIGVRPLEGLVPRERQERLVSGILARGGLINMRRQSDGSDVPYELNITWYDAVGEPDGIDTTLHVKRFLASQAFMLGLRGIPGVYFHSLIGTPNDAAAVESSGHARSINRRKFSDLEMNELLTNANLQHGAILTAYRRMLEIRSQQPAFHPDARQEACCDLPPSLTGYWRMDDRTGQAILVLLNVSHKRQSIEFEQVRITRLERDLLKDQASRSTKAVHIEPFDAVWLRAQHR